MPGGQFSTAKLFGMTIRESANDGSDFTNPDADYRRLFLGEDGELHVRDSAGTVTTIGAGTGNSLSVTSVFLDTGQNVSGSGTDTAISWTDEAEDDAGCWAIGTPTKIVIPAGLNTRRAVITAQAFFGDSAAGTYRMLSLWEGGTAGTLLGAIRTADAPSAAGMYLQVQSKTLTLATGDEFELYMRIDATGVGVQGDAAGVLVWMELRTVD